MLGKHQSATRAALLAGVALGLVTPAHAQQAADIAAMEQQLRALQQEIEALKAQQQAQQQQIEQQAASAARILPVSKDLKGEAIEFVRTCTPPGALVSHPGAFLIPGTDTCIKIGGYVKGDLIYDFDEDTGDSFAVSAITPNVDNFGLPIPDKDGEFRAHARQTRVNLTTWTPTAIGEFETFIEGDFFGTGGNEVFSNSTGFRLRHAYAQLTQPDFSVLVGQTWTNFMPLTSYPETVDFFGPQGIPFIRQGQARFTYTGIENFSFSVSAENSELTARDDLGNIIGSDGEDLQFGIDKIPDFTAAIEYNDDAGWHARIAGVARLLSTDTAGPPAFVLPDEDEEFGWGLTASAVVPMGALGPAFGEDSIQANFTYGDGIGRYLIAGFAQDAFVDTVTGTLEPVESWGVAAGYTHHWSEQWRSNLVYGIQEFDNTFFADDTKRLQSVHVNLFWSPIESVNIGFEYMYGLREFDNRDGFDRDDDANRIQAALQVSF